MSAEFTPQISKNTKLAAMAALAERYAKVENSVAHGGHVRTIAAGHYTVAGLSRHLHLGDFVAHRSATGIHLGEVVRVEPELAYVCPIEPGEPIAIGDTVIRKGAFRIAAQDSWCGRTINALGDPIDGLGPLASGLIRRSISNTAPSSMGRMRVETGFRTGVKAVDIFSPLCLGQRLGVFAGSGVGKSTLLSMLARADAFDKVVIALVGERGREVREFMEHHLDTASRQRCVVVAATSDRSSIERVKAAHVATTIAEYFRDQGKHVLLAVDNITRFARAQREIGLAAGEPPTRRGFPPSFFAALPRLLERAGPSSTGSITGLYNVLMEGDGVQDPVVEEVQALLDGHIFLSSDLAQRNHFPAIDVVRSNSRLMSKVIDNQHRATAAHIRRLLARYQEVELLIRIGEYEKGSDALTDEAIAKIDTINGFLQQKQPMRASIEETLRLMQEITA